MLEFDEYRLRLTAQEESLRELGQALDMDGLSARKKALEEESMAPSFYDDLENSQKVLQKIKQLDNKISSYQKLYASWEDLLALVDLGNEMEDASVLPEVKEGFDGFIKSLEEMKLATLLTGPYDKNNAILTFHAGAGGTEAQDWAAMLLRMYQMWAERRGFTVTTLDYLDGDEAGVKSCTILISGQDAYGYAKCEKGVHRLVRISPFDMHAALP